MRLLRESEQGFSLIELLLSVTIIGLLVGLSMPVYQTFQNRSDIDVTTQGIADALRRAQSYARSGNGDSVWSFSMQPASKAFFIYKGNNFATRDTAYDEPFNLLGGGVVTSGLSAVTFSKLSGAPSTTGSIVLTGNNNETRTITINAEGMVTY